MTLKIYYQEDCDVFVLKGHKVAIIDYDSQGHAYVLNLKDSGVDAYVDLYEGSKSGEKAEKQGLMVKTNIEAVKWADIIMILVNDELQADMYKRDIEPNLNEGGMFTSAHSSNTHFGLITPPKFVDVTMIAPKAPGHTVRSESLDGRGVSMLIAVEQDVTDKVLGKVLAYGAVIGGARAGLLEATYRTETETSFFGEQAVLCGGVCVLMQVDFDTLVEMGYDPRNAYLGCIHEIKLIVNLIHQSGFRGMRYSISNTAELDDYVFGPKLITDETGKAMKKILSDTQDGISANQLLLDMSPTGRQAHFRAMRRKASGYLSESIGKEIRKFYGWSNKDSKLINS